jgi:hypothetical protein
MVGGVVNNGSNGGFNGTGTKSNKSFDGYKSSNSTMIVHQSVTELSNNKSQA